MKNEKFIIVGKSGSGKDYLLKGLIERGERYAPKVTTRPIREGEVNGVEYDFIDNQQFQFLIEEKRIKVQQKFVINGKDWNYGITVENFNRHNLFIMTPYEITQLTEEDRKGCFIVYLDIDESVRRKRISIRFDNNDSIDRRIAADEQDFLYFDTYDLKISDSDFEIDLIQQFAY